MRGSWWTAVQALLALPLTFGVNIVVARSLGPAHYGSLATYMAAFGLVVIVLNAGISDATIQWGAAALARGDRAELRMIVRKCAGFHMFIEAPSAAITAVVILRNESVTTQAVGAAGAALTMFLGATVVALTAMSFTAMMAKLTFLVGLGLNLAVVVAAVQSHSAGPTWVARIAATAAIPVVALALAPGDIRAAALHPSVPWRWPAGFTAFSWRTVLAGVVTMLVFSRTEVFALNAYGKVGAAGMFALAAGLAGQITAPVDAIAGPLVPAAASLVALDTSRAAGAVLRGIRLSALATVPIVCLALPCVSILVPVIYGRRFHDTGLLFVTLGLVSCVQSALAPVGAFLAAWRRPVLLFGVSVIALVFDVALTLSLVPSMGAAGAVVGNTAGQLISFVAYAVLLRRFLGLAVRRTAHALIPFAGAAVVSAAACVAGIAGQRHGLDAWLSAALAVIVASGAAVLVVRAVGGAVAPDDLVPVRSAFPRLSPPVIRGLVALGWVRSVPSPEPT